MRPVRKPVKPARRVSSPSQGAAKRPRLRTLTAGNTVERFRNERNGRKKAKRGLAVMLAAIALFALFGAWKSGLIGGMTKKVENTFVAAKVKAVGWIPFKSAAKKENKIELKQSASMFSRVKAKLPFGGNADAKVTSRAVMLLEIEGYLYPVDADYLVQPKVESGYYDLPILKLENSASIKAGSSLIYEKLAFDLMDAFEKRAPEMARKIAILRSVRSEDAVQITFSDAAIPIKVGRGRSIEEQVDNIVVLRSNICPDSIAEINLQHAGVAFVTMKE